MDSGALNSTLNWVNSSMDLKGLEIWVVNNVGQVIVGVIISVIALLFAFRFIQPKTDAKRIQLEKEADQEAKRKENYILKLIDNARKWKELLPEIPPTEETRNLDRFDGFDTKFIGVIKNLFYFQAILDQYPLLKKIWKDFELLCNDYSLEKQGLFDSIDKDVEQKLEKQNINVESIKDGFSVSICRDVTIEAKGKNGGYDYFWDGVLVKGVLITHLKYCKKWRSGQILNHTDVNEFDTRFCSSLAWTDEPKEIEDIHKKLIIECKEKYAKKSKNLIIHEGKLRDCKNELNRSLETIFEKLSLEVDFKSIKGV